MSRLIIDKNRVYTLSDTNLSYYGERVTKKGDKFLREFDSRRSKIGAAIKKGFNPVIEGKSILYIGCSTGTTVSHLSDLTKKEIIGVDIAPIVMREFLLLAKERENVIPLLYDASELDKCKLLEQKKFDIVFQDIAQRNMVETFITNYKNFTNQEGWLSLKTKSIDSTKHSKATLMEAQNKLEKAGLHIRKVINLEPFEKDHYFIVVTK